MAEYIVDTTEGVLDAKTTGKLIRCKDCDWFEHLRDGEPFCSCWYHQTFDDDYCSDGIESGRGSWG